MAPDPTTATLSHPATTAASGPLGPTTPKPLSLRRNFSWTFAGNVVYAGCQWGMLMVLAKLGSPEMVGQFALGLAVTAPIMMFANLQLRGVQATDAKREYQFGDYLALRLITTTLAFGLIVAVAMLCGYRRDTALVIIAIGFAKAIESFSDVIFGLLQQHERMDRIARLHMIKGPISLFAMGLIVYLTGSIIWGMVALAAVWALRLFFYDLPSAIWVQGNAVESALRPRWNLRTLTQLAWLALPLGLVTVLISLETNVPRYVIENSMSERELGIFAAMAYFMVAGRTIISAVSHSAVPRFARYYAESNLGEFRRLLVVLELITSLIGMVLIIIAVFWGDRVLELLYGAEYAVYSDVFAWVAIAAALRFIYELLHHAVRAMRCFTIQLAASAANLIILLVLCVILANQYGLKGVAWAMIASNMIDVLTYILIFNYFIKKNQKTVHVSCAARMPG